MGRMEQGFKPMGEETPRITLPYGGPVTGVAISGKIATGKSWLAGEIMKHVKPGHDHKPSRRLALADQLKIDVGLALQEIEPRLFPPNWFEKPYTILNWVNANKHRLRGMLQDVGLLMREEMNEDYWVDRMFQTLYTGNGRGGNKKGAFLGVVDDLRFQSEFEALEKRGFLLVRLEVPTNPDSKKVYIQRRGELYPDLSPSNIYHPSEDDLDDWEERFHIVLDCTRPKSAVWAAYIGEARRYKWA